MPLDAAVELLVHSLRVLQVRRALQALHLHALHACAVDDAASAMVRKVLRATPAFAHAPLCAANTVHTPPWLP